MKEWDPWIADCLDLMDGDGTFAHWHYPGSHAEQPDIDLQIYNIIRGRWNDLRNEAIKASATAPVAIPVMPARLRS